jgi:molybdopterin-guanine dinucleotide biosynthesis protein A
VKSKSAPALAAAVLTGGKSSRMRRDKSLIRFKGKTLAALSAQRLLKAGYSPVLVVGPKKAYGLPKGVELLKERWLGRGPLSGAEAALRRCGTNCLILPCDLPFMSVAVLKRMRLQFKGKRLHFKDHPLPAIFLRRDQGLLKRRLKRGALAVWPLMAKAKAISAPPKALLNWNRPTDL